MKLLYYLLFMMMPFLLISQEKTVFDEVFQDNEPAMNESGSKQKDKDVSAEDFIIKSNSSQEDKILAIKDMAAICGKAKKSDKQIATLWKIITIPDISAEQKAKVAAEIGRVCEPIAYDGATGHVIKKYHDEMLKAYRAAVEFYRPALKSGKTPKERLDNSIVMIQYCMGVSDAESTKEALDIVNELLAIPAYSEMEKLSILNQASWICDKGAEGKYKHLLSGYIEKQAQLKNIGPNLFGEIILRLAENQFWNDKDLQAARKTLVRASSVQITKKDLTNRIIIFQDMLSDED